MRRERKKGIIFLLPDDLPLLSYEYVLLSWLLKPVVLLNVVDIIAMWDPIWIIFTIWGNKNEFHTFLDVLYVWYCPTYSKTFLLLKHMKQITEPQRVRTGGLHERASWSQSFFVWSLIDTTFNIVFCIVLICPFNIQSGMTCLQLATVILETETQQPSC